MFMKWAFVGQGLVSTVECLAGSEFGVFKACLCYNARDVNENLALALFMSVPSLLASVF